MTDAVASTSGAAGTTRKRVRKRSRKSKTNTAAGADSDAESVDQPQPQPQHKPQPQAAAKATTTSAAAVQASTTPAAANTPAASVARSVRAENPHKPSFITRPTAPGGRRYTVSVAIPGSIVLNAQSPELQSRLAAHIARACAIFNVDEIVIFDEGDVRSLDAEAYASARPAARGSKRRWNDPQHETEGAAEGEEEQQQQGEERGGECKGFDPQTFLARVLQYLETPQYLRKALFPMHRDLRLAGLMPPLDCPHHLRFEDECEYREGVTVDPPHWARQRRPGGVFVNVGLRDPIEAALPTAVRVEAGTRVTVQMPATPHEAGLVVSPREPVERLGWYWGYSVRLAASLSAVLTECAFSSDGYDLVIGTSERGVSLTDLALATHQATRVALPDGQTVDPLAKPQHALIVFGGLSGLELAVEADKGIQLDRHNANELFDAWINVVDNQGSRTVRSEEAIMIALARVKPLLDHLAAAKP